MAALPEKPELDEVRTMLAERVQGWFDEKYREGLEEGLEQARAREKKLLRRLAARKFDAETAARLSELLDGLAVPDQLEEVGAWILECETGADLLERTERMVRRGDFR